jgi:zinc and cadmium transporter
VLLTNKQGRNKTIFFIMLFAVMAPAGYFFSNALSTGDIGNLQHYFNRIMGVVIGIFLHISTTIFLNQAPTTGLTCEK